MSGKGLTGEGGRSRIIHTYTSNSTGLYRGCKGGLKFMIKMAGYCTVMGEPCVLECAGMLTCPFVSLGFLMRPKWLHFYSSFCNLYWIPFLFIFLPLWSWYRASLITCGRCDIGPMICTPENNMGFTCSFSLVVLRLHVTLERWYGMHISFSKFYILCYQASYMYVPFHSCLIQRRRTGSIEKNSSDGWNRTGNHYWVAPMVNWLAYVHCLNIQKVLILKRNSKHMSI
jgi:hypothetical protein